MCDDFWVNTCSPGDIQVRPASATDAELLQDLAALCPPLEVHTAFSYWIMLQSRAGVGLIATNGEGHAVGFLTAQVQAEGAPRERCAYIWQIGVIEDYRSAGVARRLLDEMWQRADGLQVTEFRVTIEPGNLASISVFSAWAAALGGELRRVGTLELTDKAQHRDTHETLYSLRVASPEVPAAFNEGAEIDALPLFIYGNLLPGRSLGHVLEPHIQSQLEAWVSGSLHLHSTGRFPVLVPDRSINKVHGLLVELRVDREILGLLTQEEIAFGYEATWSIAHPSDGSTPRNAVLFVWPWKSAGLGAALKHGRYGEAQLFDL